MIKNQLDRKDPLFELGESVVSLMLTIDALKKKDIRIPISSEDNQKWVLPTLGEIVSGRVTNVKRLHKTVSLLTIAMKEMLNE
jgi:exosome complex RNA-binding protein Csl4